MCYVTAIFFLTFIYVQAWVDHHKLEGHKIWLWLRTLCTLSHCTLRFSKFLLFGSEIYTIQSKYIRCPESDSVVEVNIIVCISKKKKNPITVLDRPWGFQEVEAPRFQDNQHMWVVGLSALRNGCFYPPRKYSWCSFLLEAESTPGP